MDGRPRLFLMFFSRHFCVLIVAGALASGAVAWGGDTTVSYPRHIFRQPAAAHTKPKDRASQVASTAVLLIGGMTLLRKKRFRV